MFRPVTIATLLVCAFLLSGLSAVAQEYAPLIREEPEVKVRVRDPQENLNKKKSEDEEEEEEWRATPTPTPTPDPESTVVAVVNRNSLTMAQMNRRVAALTGVDPTSIDEAEALDQARASIGPGADTGQVIDRMLAADQQQRFVRAAIRRQEEKMVYEWVDQMMLADEARRQGLVISERELQERMALYEREFRLDDPSVDSVLTNIGMSREEFESYIYDAILIEKLLERYVQLNVTEEELRASYEREPIAFQTPASFKIAHFVASVSGQDTDPYIKALRRLAERVRGDLRDGKDPENVFEEHNDLELGIYGDVYTWSIDSSTVDDRVRRVLKDMKEGEVSRVLEMSVKIDDEIRPEAFHVIKLLKIEPAKGTTYEEALPKIRRVMAEVARQAVLEKLREAKSHRVVINFSGIPADKMPDPVELRKPKLPVDLREEPKDAVSQRPD